MESDKEAELNQLRRQVAVLEERMKAIQAKSESAYERLLAEIAQQGKRFDTAIAQLKTLFTAETAKLEAQTAAEMSRREARMMIWVAIVVGVAFAADKLPARDPAPVTTQNSSSVAQVAASAGRLPIAQASATPGETQ